MTDRRRHWGRWLLAAVVVGLGAVGLARLSAWMQINRGIFAHLQRDDRRAVEILSNAELGPGDFLSVQCLVTSQLRLGRREEALRTLTRLSREHPEWAAPQFELGLLALREGDWEQACPLLAQAGELPGEQDETPLIGDLRGLAEAAGLIVSGRPAEALARLGDVPVLREDDEEPKQGEADDARALLQALALVSFGRWDQAEAPLDVSLALHADNPLACVLKALLLARGGNWHEARHWLDIARSISPALANETFHREIRRQIDLANASPVPDIGANALPRDSALAWLCDLWLASSQPEAITSLLQSQPNPEMILNAQVWAAWANASRDLGDEEAKAAHYARAYELNPSWEYDPDWPRPEVVLRANWMARRWTEVALPASGELPEGSGRYGESLEQVNVYANAALDIPVVVHGAGHRRVLVTMYGRPSGAVWPLVDLSVLPGPPTVHYVNSPYPYAHVAVLPFADGDNTLRVSYVNDFERLAAGQDRSVRIVRIFVETEPFGESVR